MTKIIKKLFGGINLTWPKLIIAAVAAGAYTAAMAIIPELHYTSFNTITVSFEVWILFGILIIMNSKSNLDSALKCFVFFLISQPLVYLIQVPFSSLGWSIMGYYKNWILWTVFCLPMGFIGYYMKKGKWWGYFILLPMIGLTAFSYATYFSDFLFYISRYILICLFCVCVMLIYPLAIFKNKKIRIAGVIISAAAVIAATTICLLKPPVYSTELLGNSTETTENGEEKILFDDTYKVYLADDKYGTVKIIYIDSVEDYFVHADLRRAGKTVLTLESPSGEKKEYDLSIEKDTYDLTER